MKHLLSVLLFISLTGNAFCQEADKISKAQTYLSKQDRLVLSFTSDNWTKLPAGIKGKPFRSRGFGFLILDGSMDSSNTVGFAYGIGFSSQNVHTNASIQDTSGQTFLTPIPNSLKKETNKLSLNFIDVALEFRLHSKENASGKNFKFNVGLKAGYLLQSHIKYEDKNGKFKTYGINNLNKFQYGVTARLGYSKVGLCLYYSLVPVFKKNKAPEMTPYSVGIAVGI